MPWTFDPRRSWPFRRAACKTMSLIIAMSVLFLLSPVIGYVLISLNVSLRTKLIAGAVIAFLLTVSPILVMLFAGGNAGG